MQSDNPNEDPLERIHYTDGQRLTGELLRKEQDYHLRLQRLLNQNLFTPGVAGGLEVFLKEDGTVEVTPGLALDGEGRALVLVESRVFEKVDGRFLTIRFAERAVRESGDGCLVAPVSPDARPLPTSWKGPALYRLEPELRFRNRKPEDDLEIVLAEFSFDSKCTPVAVTSGPTQYATATQLAHIHTFALEGEKDIDPKNPKRLYFHIRGRTPTSVVLYLRSEKAESMFYDVPAHNHPIGTAVDAPYDDPNSGLPRIHTSAPDKVDDHNHDISHSHTAGAKARATVRKSFSGNDITNYLVTGPVWDDAAMLVGLAMIGGLATVRPIAGVVVPTIPAGVAGAMTEAYGVPALALQYGFATAFPPPTLNALPGLGGFQLPAINFVDPNGVDLKSKVGMEITVQDSATTESGLPVHPNPTHVHSVPGETQSTGEANPSGTNPRGLYVKLGTPEVQSGIDITEDVRSLLTSATNPLEWGSGTAGDGLDWTRLLSGTGEIKLSDIKAFPPGEYWVELSLQPPSPGARSSGRVHYNLYVEAE